MNPAGAPKRDKLSKNVLMGEKPFFTCGIGSLSSKLQC
jgi:hypothetical protein